MINTEPERKVHSPPWAAAEDDTVREVYPDGGYMAVQEHLPNRTMQAIFTRATRLGVERTIEPFPWPKDELSVAWREWRGPVEPGPLRWAA